ncbi:hypothetical protein LTR35_010905 [Friedmanniomyces endolithicus]|uniref:Uncharacterized protein n=1 Tax=Friedmanniomyces endolithicus TaxID=329885 RepID=A0AAN6J9T9_9PEZI|nr:hypothetical protein LTS00_015084 [Friedmanniomyces endolithicus]KAK0275635.1 hypothetical protein LTR35_010905 [Friedmanniomyces endolithicus]KAK0316154.1 hypothetical protein LTR82_012182 [Friedmanniomyces endolithicus]
MEEDTRLHDFDQRHDGPFDQPLPISTSHDSPHYFPSSRRQSESAVRAFGEVSSPARPIGRKSTQLPRSTRDEFASPPLRVSTSIWRNDPADRDFDIRRDGPYGRPSLTMERRRSSGKIVSPDGRRPTLPVQTEEEKADEERLHAALEAGTPTEPAETEEPSIETLAFEPEPPPLNYSLWKRKWSIVFFWGLIIIDCVFMPIGLYFGLWYGTNLTPNIVFSIVTAALGGISIFEYVLRFRRLFKKSSTCRVIGARRMYLDWFHWNFSLGWGIIMIELIIGTIPANPPIRLLAMPVTSMLFVFGTELLLVDALRFFHLPAPCRLSSIPKGSQLRPAIYTFIEDVCAVDGSGGTAYREALNKRYEASHIFRAMLRRLGAFWAVGSEGCAVLCTVLVFTIQHEAAYVVGWALPFMWAGVWSAGTYFFVVRMLREEKRAWAEEIAAKGGV